MPASRLTIVDKTTMNLPSTSAFFDATLAFDSSSMPAGSPDVSAIPDCDAGTLVNDIHSQLNETRVAAIVKPHDLDELRSALAEARRSGRSISIAGGRHAMGGQQFGEGAALIDTRGLDRVLSFDPARGHIIVQSGIQWPALIEYLERAQAGFARPWGIYQKQTGADRLSLGGALSSNVHGRGLTLKPIVQQVESFDLMDHTGDVVRCSRTERPDLFRLAIGGYGLFGVITSVTLRLCPRVKVRRVVRMASTSEVMSLFDDRIRDGFLYGDYQFMTDAASDGFLGRGIMSCYQPVADDIALTPDAIRFTPEEWARLTFYSHCDKPRAFELYSRKYLQTSGQIYWGDWQLFSSYVDHYHTDLDRALRSSAKGSEMITELYVPPNHLASFMTAAGALLRRRRADVIYGTVRLIEEDDETFLRWARQRYACVVLNLHVEHTPRAVADAADAFRELIDLAIAHDGSYYLTYHRWARRDQVERCYPQMREFLATKRRYDPDELFQSDWYRHYRLMFEVL
jgi:FAD/FMN-containing dehydrogenase